MIGYVLKRFIIHILLQMFLLLLGSLCVCVWNEINMFCIFFYAGASVLCMCLMLLGSGIITTTTFTLMMFCSQRASAKIQASHYTTLATVEVLGKLTFSVMIGSVTDMVGYHLVFLLFISLAILVLPVLNKCPKFLVELSNEHNKNSWQYTCILFLLFYSQTLDGK